MKGSESLLVGVVNTPSSEISKKVSLPGQVTSATPVSPGLIIARIEHLKWDTYMRSDQCSAHGR